MHWAAAEKPVQKAPHRIGACRAAPITPIGVSHRPEPINAPILRPPAPSSRIWVRPARHLTLPADPQAGAAWHGAPSRPRPHRACWPSPGTRVHQWAVPDGRGKQLSLCFESIGSPCRRIGCRPNPLPDQRIASLVRWVPARRRRGPHPFGDHARSWTVQFQMAADTRTTVNVRCCSPRPRDPRAMAGS